MLLYKEAIMALFHSGQISARYHSRQGNYPPTRCWLISIHFFAVRVWVPRTSL